MPKNIKQPSKEVRFPNLPEKTHQLCKAAAALKGKDLKDWLSETLEREATKELHEFK
jgi:hypothetical protein